MDDVVNTCPHNEVMKVPLPTMYDKVQSSTGLFVSSRPRVNFPMRFYG